jgi:hypothetical protein
VVIDRRALIAWSAVHATRPALSMQFTAVVIGIAFGAASVSQIGFVRLPTPVAVLLLVPVLAGTGAALASVTTFDLHLPDPVNARVARAGWALGWLAIACTTSASGLILGAEVSPASIGRNVLLITALGLAVVRVEQGRYVWVPAATLTLLAMLFGHPDERPGYYWWAMMLEERTTAGHLIISGALYLVALANLACGSAPRPPRLVRRRRSRARP